MEKVCVAVRVRPSVLEESTSGMHWKVEKNRICLLRQHGTPIRGFTYTFDHIFDQNCTNEFVYELLAKDIIHAAVEGFNGTAFAYGQTSSGKTFTMNGSEADPGIILRAVKDVFENIQQMIDREFLVRVSYMEIYNEEINDLFAIESQKLQVHESLERGVFVKGLKEEIVNNAEHVLKLIALGEANRHFGETNMNIRSSRSHTIFRMVIESKGKDYSSCNGNLLNSDAIRVSVLNLVDLAGSERIAKTGAGGMRLKEGKHINKSLMILGNVINKLGDGSKQKGHIPYRDSKLTRILQPALGGNAKTSIICTMAPEEIHIEESKGTLQFASRAQCITNCIQVNEILTDAALLKRQKLEIEELRNKLQGSHAEVLEKEILKLRNEMLKYELEREKLELELEEERKSHKQRDEPIREQQLKISNLNDLVISSDSNQDFVEDKCQGGVFETPRFRLTSSSFVAKRSNYSRLPDCSPIPASLTNVADEDAWCKMNNGFIADLDFLEMTPARVQSFPCGDIISEKCRDQITENDKLNEEISHRLTLTIAKCRDVYEDVISDIRHGPILGEDSRKAELLLQISEVGSSLLSSLEAQVSIVIKRLDVSASDCEDLLQEELNVLRKRLHTCISSVLLPSGAPLQKGCMDKGGIAELHMLEAKYEKLEREFEAKTLLLEDSREKCHELERGRNLLLKNVSESSITLENVRKDLDDEVQKRKELEKDMKQFSMGFASRHKLLWTLQNEFGSCMEKLKARNLVSVRNQSCDNN